MSSETPSSELGSWEELAEDDHRLASPSEITNTPVDPQLELLPTHEMTWPNFERLLVRVTREVQGLRSVQLYGVSGQAQEGIDLVGINPAEENEAVQGKRYQTFAVEDLDNAVKKYLDGKLPFALRRLAIAASCRAHEKKVTDRVIELNNQRVGIEFELWDRDRLSEMLRNRPDIVREFFGPTTAVRFCGEFEIRPQPAPPLDAVAIADAVMRGPAETSGANEELNAAEQCGPTNLDDAVAHIRNAQQKLRGAGFAAHARVLDGTIADILVQAGHSEEAGLLLLDRVWSALENDDTDDAAQLSRRLKTLSGGADRAVLRALSEVSEAAVASCQHPLGLPPDVAVLAADIPAIHRARLLLLAGETELAQGRAPFDAATVTSVRALLTGAPELDEGLAVRLQLCVAESDEDWTSLLARARTRSIGRALSALVLARHARHLADRGHPEAADTEWNEAVEQACLAKINGDAANWLYSQRMVAMRHLPPMKDPYHSLAAALKVEAGLSSVVGSALSARESALTELQAGKLRPAAIRLQRYLRDSAVGASWADEHEARRMLADVLKTSGEAQLSAHHLILAGDAASAHDLGGQVGDRYLDVTGYLDDPTYWVKASALRLIAAQADLVPDSDVEAIAERAFTVLDEIQTGQLRDTPLFSPSAYLATHEVLAAFGERLNAGQAERLLDLLEPLASVDAPGRYRHTDKFHAIACAGIGRAHPSLAERAVDQLLTLLERAGHDVPSEGHDLIVEHLEHSRQELERQQAAGCIDAGELLAHADPDSIDPSAAEEAAAALTKPTVSGPNSYAIGTDAVYRSGIARYLPPNRRADLIRAQIGRCRSPYESVMNRRDYLLAAANLTDDISDADNTELFDATMTMTREVADSEADAVERMLGHPLGAMRVTSFGDDRPAAAFLAARLARTTQQKAMARDAAIRLLGATEEGDYWPTRALQVLSDDLTPNMVPVLARLSWPLRSLAAIVWVQSEGLDSALGVQLARELDPRVRRALAGALATIPWTDRTEPVRHELANDPRFSVRTALSGRS